MKKFCEDFKKYATRIINYESIKDNQLIFWCFEYQKNYQKEFNKELIKRFADTYEFCNVDINKFVLLLRKGVYPHGWIHG